MEVQLAWLTIVVLTCSCHYGATGYKFDNGRKHSLDDVFAEQFHHSYRAPDSNYLEQIKAILENIEDEETDNTMDVDEFTPDSDDALLSDFMAHFQIIFSTHKTQTHGLSNREKVAQFLKTYQKELVRWADKSSLAEWTKETNLTKPNIKNAKQATLNFSAWENKERPKAEKLKKDESGLTFDQKRMLRYITDTDAIEEKDLDRLNVDLQAKLSKIYSDAKVCNETSGKCYKFEPGLIKIMSTSRDYSELLWAWKGWRDAIGPKTRKDWYTSMTLENRGAREHGHSDVGEYQRYLYEDTNFEKDIDDLWKKLEPLYKELHAYVRFKLNKQYGNRVPLDKPIPAHLLGDMWAMKWDGILNLVEPYPEIGGFDVTGGMKKQNFTVHKMFTLADEFYQSIGLPKMTKEFWEKSMFTRPADGRPVVCYASAHNLGGDDVRIKMCAVVSSEYLYVVHHEMGHCQYYLGYNRNQPQLFRGGANNGFHEAIGDTAALAVISPKHLENLKILEASNDSGSDKKKKDLNFLMQKALGKLAFYPFAMTMSKWSWDVFSGKIPKSELNAAWWQYKKKYQGIMPPVTRTEHDFDPGSKYHVTNFVPYIRYFVSHVLQFQFFEALCDLAGYEGPLHRCDFAGSKHAGKKFEEMLAMGSSKPWPQALHVLTNTTKMSADSAIRYFQPLLTWLKDENKRLGIKVGWD